MIVWKKAALLLLLIPLLAACWSKYELPERAFVMGVALDLRDDGKLEMLTQLYRPSSAESGSGPSTSIDSSINIKTVDNSVMETIRDIPIHLGRKAQWSHMRVIIVGEKLARTHHLMKTLDLFIRDHEPRNSVSIMIAKGKAAKLLEKKPLAEQTTSQQFLRTNESAYVNSAKTLRTTLLDLAKVSKSQTQAGVIGYVYEDPKSPEYFSAAGLALIQDGKVKSVLTAGKAEGLLMLRNDYKSGVVEIQCSDSSDLETAEVLSLQTVLKPKISGEEIKLEIKMEGSITINELKCSKLDTPKAEQAFLEKVEESLKGQAASAMDTLQQREVDGMGLGNLIYRHHPKLWKGLKTDWNQRFAAVPYTISIKIKLISSGTISSKILS